MKKIELTKGEYALVDDKDFEYLNQWSWYTLVNRKKKYAVRKPMSGIVLMHREILSTPKTVVVDHIDGDGLNNQRVNLRNCTDGENKRNRGMQRNNTSGVKGVSWSRQAKKWHARISVDKKSLHLGYFVDKNDAYEACRIAYIEHHKEFANYN